jgi:hypothetical protein
MAIIFIAPMFFPRTIAIANFSGLICDLP